MANKYLYYIWAGLYALCAGLGFISSAEGFLYGLLVLIAIGFFIPPAILLHRGIKNGNVGTVRLICALSAVSLCATLALIILNLMTVGSTAAIGKAFYWVLVVVSAPMVCGRVWGISLFLWACLLMVCLRELRKLKKK